MVCDGIFCDFVVFGDFPDLGVFRFGFRCFDFAFRLLVLGLFIWCFVFWKFIEFGCL